MSECCDQGVVRTRVGRNRWDVVELWLVRWGCEHCVDDVNDAVRSHDVSGGNRGVSDLHGLRSYAECCFVAVEHGDGESVGNRAGFNRSVVHVVEEDIGERIIGFIGVEVGQVNAGCCECSVRWGKHRERSVSLQGFNESCMGECCDQ